MHYCSFSFKGRREHQSHEDDLETKTNRQRLGVPRAPVSHLPRPPISGRFQHWEAKVNFMKYGIVAFMN